MGPNVKHQTQSEAAKAEMLDLESESFQASDFLSLSEDESVQTEKNFLKDHLHITPSETISLRLGESAVVANGLPAGTSSDGKMRKRKSAGGERYTFKTRSESEVIDDGYKWRKYGRKIVKNSPNPRNYYKCANTECCVKKKVQRDTGEKGIVLTTYEGKHNHQSPSIVYYVRKTFLLPPNHVSCDQAPALFYSPSCQPDAMFIDTT